MQPTWQALYTSTVPELRTRSSAHSVVSGTDVAAKFLCPRVKTIIAPCHGNVHSASTRRRRTGHARHGMGRRYWVVEVFISTKRGRRGESKILARHFASIQAAMSVPAVPVWGCRHGIDDDRQWPSIESVAASSVLRPADVRHLPDCRIQTTYFAADIVNDVGRRLKSAVLFTIYGLCFTPLLSDKPRF